MPSPSTGDGPDLRHKLVSARIATETQIAETIAEQTGYPYVDLAALTLSAETIGAVPAALCRRYHVIPIERGRRSLPRSACSTPQISSRSTTSRRRPS
ncbi:GspE/PulE/PilB domain-containing protein [Microbacterium aurum]